MCVFSEQLCAVLFMQVILDCLSFRRWMVPTEHLRKHPVVYGTCLFQFSFGFFLVLVVFFGGCVVVCFSLGGGRVFVCVYVCFGFVAFFVLVYFFSKIPLLSFNALEVFQAGRGCGFSKSGGHVVAYILLPWIGSHVSI